MRRGRRPGSRAQRRPLAIRLLADVLDARRERAARRARGRMGEAKVAEVLDELADRFGLKVQHSIPLTSRRNTRGDLDHVLVVGSPPRFIIAIETKAERPDDRHYDQLLANAQRASRRYFGGVPQYRIIVHPNSSEPVVFDASRMAARMGLPRLRTYLTELLQGTHPDRLVA